MLYLWRVPGLLVRRRSLALSLLLLILTIVYYLLHWGIVCTNLEAWHHVSRLCQLHQAGLAVGTLCRPLCVEGEIHSLTCHSLHAGKEAVFSAKWGSSKIVFKGVPALTDDWFTGMDSPSDSPSHSTISSSQVLSEDRFRQMLRDVISAKLNVSTTPEQMERLVTLGLRSLPRDKEMRALWPLVQDNEYLCSILYRELDVFPQVVGTCGPFFAVEFAEPVQSLTGNSGGSRAEIRAAWVERVRIGVMILDLLDELETDLPEPFHLCDVKSSHFGLVHGGNRVKFLDLDAVAPRGMVNHVTGDNSPCTKHEDCDYFDCRSRCSEGRCRSPVLNDNHQVVCEKVFLGWTLRGAVIVPGLLMSEHTPSSLAALLRLCANPEMGSDSPRVAVPEDIKHRLYSTLSELSRQLSDQQAAAET